MQSFKLTPANIEHADKLVPALDSTDQTTRAKAELRATAIAEEIAAIDPDILLIVEGPKGEDSFSSGLSETQCATRAARIRSTLE